MKLVSKLILACIPLAALTACGGGDTEDRLDVADPVVRFVHAAPAAQKIERVATPQTNFTAPSPEQAVEVSQDAPKQTAKRNVGQTKAPLINTETNASQDPTLTTVGTGGASVNPKISVNPKK